MFAAITDGSAQVKELRNGMGRSTSPASLRDVVDEADALVEHPPPDDRHRDRHQRVGDEDDRAVDVAAANVGIDEQREPERHRDAERRARHIDQRVPERGPEHLIMKEHLLVMVEPGPARRPHRRPVLERQHEVPAERDDAVEQEDRKRGQEEAPDEHRLAHTLAREKAGAAGSFRDDRGGAHPQIPSLSSPALSRRSRSNGPLFESRWPSQARP